jgi:hypothetical protein
MTKRIKRIIRSPRLAMLDVFSAPPIWQLKIAAKIRRWKLQRDIKRSKDEKKKRILNEYLEEVNDCIVNENWFQFYLFTFDLVMRGKILSVEFFDVDDDYELRFNEVFVDK